MNGVKEKPSAIFNPHSHTVLVIDDEPANLTVVVDYLANYNFQIKVARTGEAGLELARQAPPDLILLDVVLPGIDGFEVCRRLKADTQTQEIPVIFMTILTRMEDKVQGFEIGGVDYITKPFQREEVLARVTTHLRLRELTEHLEQQVYERTEELKKVTQAYKALSNCNQMMIRVTEEGKLLQEVCRIIVRDCGYRLVWIGFAEHDQAKTVRPVAQAGYEEGYLETINLTWADTERRLGPTGTAIRTKKPVINREVLTNPDFAPWRAEAVKRGYASSAALPLLTGEQEALGALNVYAVEPDAFTLEEITLLTELAGDLAYGITVLRTRAEQKRAEEGLRESERRYRGLFENSPLPMWEEDFSQVKDYFDALRAAGVGDFRGYFKAHPEAVTKCAGLIKVLDVNQATLTLVSAKNKKELLAGLRWNFTENSFQAFVEELITLAEDKQCFESEAVYQKLTGEEQVVNLHLSVAPGYESSLGKVLVSMLDVTERRRAEEALKLNAERSTTLLRLNQMTGATLKDLITFAFEEAVRLTESKIGYLAFLNAEETVLTMQVWSRGAMAECTIDDKPIHYPVETTGLWGEAVRQRRPIITNTYAAPHPWKKGLPAGHVHLVRHMNVPVIVDGKIVLVAGVGNKEDDYDETDVQQLTLLMEGMWRLIERKRAEEELQKHRDHLEELVRQRTAELAEARDRAEEANRVKSAFLANISHELRTPLNGILGYAEILKRRIGYTGSLVDGLDIIQRSGEHLLILINDLLDLAKIEANKLELNPAPFHLPTFLRQITDVVRARAEDKGLFLTYECLSPLPEAVLADETRLRQVLLNLLGNAVKFTDAGHVLLRVTSRQGDSDAASRLLSTVYRLRFEVRDTGPGIPADQLDRIFRPFEQASERGKQVEGTGLGLAISRQIVQLMGGQLQVQSTSGLGSTFWFDVALPVVEIAATPPPATARRIIGYEGPPRKVLVVDDKSFNRLLVADMLEPLGFEVYTAGDGQEAIDKALRLQPDAIVMDLIMPSKTGIEAIQVIRQNPLLHDVVIIAVSASVLEVKHKTNLVAGCDEFLPKPIHVERLLEVLAARLQLIWRYAETAEQAADTLTLIAPPHQDLTTLHKLAQKGRIWDIRDYAARLAQQDARYRLFAEAIQTLAREFKNEQIMTYIQQFFKEQPDEFN